MTKKIKRLPDAECSVMQIIWQADGPVTSSYVQEQAAQDWKATSVLTFLSRLTEKGFLSCEKRGKVNFYRPLVEKEQYLQQEGANFLKQLYNGSVKDLVVSLAHAGAVTDEDLQDLRSFLDAQGEG
ncbi:BlaI/MecI/CopY family transcriptional regulator [Intestinibacillus massiliensis]|nr:BlaI/MecI/CopY family transcriptional regulator [Intestinibacillus massiliensis]